MNKYLPVLLAAVALIAARISPLPMTFSPFLAMTALMGTMMPTRIGAVLTVAAVVLGDLLLGTTSGSWMLVLLMLGMYAMGAYTKPHPGHFARNSGLAIIGFFLITNAMMLGGTMYPANATGLLASYVAGLPFLKAQLLGLLAVTAVYAFTQRQVRETREGWGGDILQLRRDQIIGG